MARTYQPVAVCGESRQYGSEWEGCPARDSSTPTLPSELGSLSNLQILKLNNNSLSGTIPSEFGAYGFFGNLQLLNLSSNNLTGTLPGLGHLGRLEYLNLSDNSLSGTIPDVLGIMGNLASLDEINLSNNSLSGTMLENIRSINSRQLENPPYVKTKIPDVEAGEDFSLNVSGNFGDINDNITSYSAEGLPQGLTINSTSGVIGSTPSELGDFSNLQDLELDYNDLSGTLGVTLFRISYSLGRRSINNKL
ncbi:MAG: hypothetical protein GDA48_27590 [Hormoscilla sp. GM102CHS1]|nr:hypothetical protein [Hormoscilla sp. GM102CHS1]